jgi:hypothetical protein
LYLGTNDHDILNAAPNQPTIQPTNLNGGRRTKTLSRKSIRSRKSRKSRKN